ncbi:hypothetical protein A2U01_0057168, partial [Trifolium medium]|nr:hypothetical protein [Trifolium medium]
GCIDGFEISGGEGYVSPGCFENVRSSVRRRSVIEIGGVDEMYSERLEIVKCTKSMVLRQMRTTRIPRGDVMK